MTDFITNNLSRIIVTLVASAIICTSGFVLAQTATNATVANKIETLKETHEKTEQRLNKIDNKIDNVREDIQNVENRQMSIETKIDYLIKSGRAADM